jgi:alpha-1,4-galacturonosyltransferase
LDTKILSKHACSFDFQAYEECLNLVIPYLQNKDRLLWKLGTLPPGLLTFYGKMQPLDRSWHVLGLGYDFNVDSTSIANAAVLHYNGNMKPWLKLALERYKPLWTRHVDFSQPFIQECNVH